MALQPSNCRREPPGPASPAFVGLLLIQAVLAGLDGGSPQRADADRLDADAVVLAYHKVSGDSLDLEEAARGSDAAARATDSTRPAVVKAEIARLQSALAATSAAREFSVRVNDSISRYDLRRGELSIGLFAPGRVAHLQAFGRSYRLVFANAARARSIAMPKAFARELDARLDAIGRVVVNEVRFRVIGSGDPSGAISGLRVIRAQIVSSQLLDPTGRLLFTRQIN